MDKLQNINPLENINRRIHQLATHSVGLSFKLKWIFLWEKKLILSAPSIAMTIVNWKMVS